MVESSANNRKYLEIYKNAHRQYCTGVRSPSRVYVGRTSGCLVAALGGFREHMLTLYGV